MLALLQQVVSSPLVVSGQEQTKWQGTSCGGVFPVYIGRALCLGKGICDPLSLKT